jgi:hypothetical protein
MSAPALISWDARTHIQSEKSSDWYWSVGIITLAIAAVCLILGQVIPAIFVVVASVTLVLHASKAPLIAHYEINDRGIVIDDTLYPFVSLESFWITHDQEPARLLVKSRKVFMPLIVIMIEGVEVEDVRQVMLKYIAETEHREPFLQHVLEGLGF